MSKAYTGGCACGRVRYEINDAPMFSNACQCRHCQQRSGSGHGSYMTFASRKGVTVTGVATHWELAGDSGNMKSHAFCPVCGTPVYLTFAAMPDFFTIHAGSLDDPSRYQPQAATYHARALSWDHLDPALPKFETMPPM
jgi:hypothetical protein